MVMSSAHGGTRHLMESTLVLSEIPFDFSLPWSSARRSIRRQCPLAEDDFGGALGEHRPRTTTGNDELPNLWLRSRNGHPTLYLTSTALGPVADGPFDPGNPQDPDDVLNCSANGNGSAVSTLWGYDPAQTMSKMKTWPMD